MNKVKIGGGILLSLLTIGLINRAFNGEKIDKRNAERDSLAVVELQKDSLSNANEKNNRDLLLQDIQSSDLVTSAEISESNVLYIEVKNDHKHNWDSVITFFCTKAKNSQAKISLVKLVEAGTKNRADRDNIHGILLAESICK